MKRSAPLRRKARLHTRTELARRTALHRQRRDLGTARATVRERAGGRCEAAITPVCIGRGAHAHHVLRRSQGGPDTPGNLLWLCPPCHAEIHNRPAWAMEHGFLRRAS